MKKAMKEMNNRMKFIFALLNELFWNNLFYNLFHVLKVKLW